MDYGSLSSSIHAKDITTEGEVVEALYPQTILLDPTFFVVEQLDKICRRAQDAED